jgi:hypothetical protein
LRGRGYGHTPLAAGYWPRAASGPASARPRGCAPPIAGEGERLVGVRVSRIDDATAELGVLAGSSPLPPRG